MAPGLPFQSTRPRGARPMGYRRLFAAETISIHAPAWGATDRLMTTLRSLVISIHAPRVGRDLPLRRHIRLERNFNPRAPCGARRGRSCVMWRRRNFNPRAPCGARPHVVNSTVLGSGFQSTRPVWGATFKREGCVTCAMISIHAPRVGRDCGHPLLRLLVDNFNPRAPRGARRTAEIWGRLEK